QPRLTRVDSVLDVLKGVPAPLDLTVGAAQPAIEIFIEPAQQAAARRQARVAEQRIQRLWLFGEFFLQPALVDGQHPVTVRAYPEIHQPQPVEFFADDAVETVPKGAHARIRR